jgi:dihydroorotase
VAEICAQEQFWPDIISTDLHTECHEGPAYDIPMTMSKLLHVGMPLIDVIRAVTIAPASAVGWQDKIGSLTPSFVADVTVLKLEDVDLTMEDCQGQIRKVSKLIIPVAVWKDGVRFDITKPDPSPGENTSRLIDYWDNLIVKDSNKPTALE